jgi:hypothetical protein
MRRRNTCNKEADVTEAGKLFQVLAAATGSALSPNLYMERRGPLLLTNAIVF